VDAEAGMVGLEVEVEVEVEAMGFLSADWMA